MSTPAVTCDLEITGRLTATATMRQLALGDGHFVPALCFEVEGEGTFAVLWHAQQPFPAGHDKECEAAARRLKRGMRVSFQVPAINVQMTARGVMHVHVFEESAAPAEAASAEQTPAPQQQELIA